MALIKSTEVGNTGLFVEYWRVLHVMRDVLHDTVHARVGAYKDEETRRADKDAVLTFSYNWNNPDVTAETNLTEWVYEQLKTMAVENVMVDPGMERSVSFENAEDG
jgi:hypothetical protein